MFKKDNNIIGIRNFKIQKSEKFELIAKQESMLAQASKKKKDRKEKDKDKENDLEIAETNETGIKRKRQKSIDKSCIDDMKSQDVEDK
eukprot:CAMPEP_0116934168 /NCGR_PEP_ID=MMETSP0467-20121206/29480_1 /TAXON_ID=283647 /ORGANISM="Mesodinium pulex, Strain SPMC105" /LENGTH=87 /DNA_ID=CAMNT_0004615205 /DNA_START=736 /DNA_END=999 /DNA_ORIENTATION=+